MNPELLKKRRNILFAIGIDKYSTGAWPNLDNAVSDTKNIIKVLVDRYSFELYPDPLYDHNATKTNIYDAFNTLKHNLDPEDNLIIFFAGHGQMNPYTSRGYWVPHEGTLSLDTLIENSVIKDFIQDIKVEHIWLIADSCFSGTFLTKTRSANEERTYSLLDSSTSRWMLASGGEEKVSDGSIGKQSPFAQYLTRFLLGNKNIYTCVSEIVKYVSVMTKNNSKQTPRGAVIDNIGHESGEMVLALKDEFVELKYDKTRGTPNTPNLRKDLGENQKRVSTLSTGKEILLIKSFVDNADYLILEIFRFDDDGKKKVKFENDYLIMKSPDGEEKFELIQRFATWQGVNRYLDIHKDFSSKYKTAVINASSEIEQVEETIDAILHAEYLQELLAFNKDVMTCLHCGKKISTNDCHMIEIDELGLKENVGNVHKDCLRPADRILGQAGYKGLKESNLINFDFSKWLDLIERGQGQLNSIKNNISEVKVYRISWNPANSENEGTYCIRMYYDDGSSSFVRLGKDIQKFAKEDIDFEVEEFGRMIKSATERGDPFGRIVQTKMFGPIKVLNNLLADAQTIVLASHCEKAKYSKQLEENSELFDNDYCPLALVFHADSNELLRIDNCIPLISDISNFDHYHENWNHIIGNLGKCTVKIIESDEELDTYLKDFFSNQMIPVIDPIFDKEKKELNSGYIFTKFSTLVSEGMKMNPEVKSGWKMDDKVKVVFPGKENAKCPTGILLTDEFVDEENEVCAIFQPVEDGAPLEMQFKMPTYLFRDPD